MIKTKIFNPKGSDTNHKVFGGDTTNLINLNSIKFKWALDSWNDQLSNFWIPEKISLVGDNVSVLTEGEYTAYLGILSYLTFLDSIQVANVPNIADYVTAPEVKLALTAQTFFEAIHAKSYAYIIESTLAGNQLAYDLWRTDDVLLRRNTYIGGIYQLFADNPIEENFSKVLIANYLLEGLYFYNGFAFFYTLASRNMMLKVASIIQLINRDEMAHCVLFQNIIKNQIELGELNTDLVYEMFDEAVKQEIEWTKHIIGDNVLGITQATTEQYTKVLANRRLKHIGLKPMFDNVKNPYEHLESMADLQDKALVKKNFFEQTNGSYNMASAVGGWDEL